MKKILSTIIIWMALLFAPQTTKAVTLEGYDYDFSTYNAENPNILYKIKLADIKPEDNIIINVFWDAEKTLLKESITHFEDGIQGPANGWNSFWLNDMPTGIKYVIEINLNGQQFNRDLLTPGDETLVAGLNLSFEHPGSTVAKFLYNASMLPDTIMLTLSKSQDYSNPVTINMYDYFYNTGNLEYYAINSYGFNLNDVMPEFTEGKIYCKLNAFAWKTGSVAEAEFSISKTGFSKSLMIEKGNFVSPNPIIGNHCVIESDHSGTINIFDSTGKLVLNENIYAGENSLTINLPTGVYHAQKTVGAKSSWQKIIIL